MPADYSLFYGCICVWILSTGSCIYAFQRTLKILYCSFELDIYRYSRLASQLGMGLKLCISFCNGHSRTYAHPRKFSFNQSPLGGLHTNYRASAHNLFWSCIALISGISTLTKALLLLKGDFIFFFLEISKRCLQGSLMIKVCATMDNSIFDPKVWLYRNLTNFLQWLTN